MTHQKFEPNILLLHLLLTSLLNQLYFCFGFFGPKGLAIDRAESRSREVTIGFFRYFLQKVLINFQSCIIANVGSEVFFFSG